MKQPDHALDLADTDPPAQLTSARETATLNRCPWAQSTPDYIAYHDTEWGVPVRDDRKMFEMLVLETAQAGLSWLTVLRKRQGYRRAFHDFDVQRVAAMTDADVERLRGDASIIRNRLKIAATITNARAFMEVQAAEGSFCEWLWGFVDNKPLVSGRTAMAEVPAVTPLAQTVSKELKRRGFKFVGPTIVYAHMQAAGLVNDHLVGCFRYDELVY